MFGGLAGGWGTHAALLDRPPSQHRDNSTPRFAGLFAKPSDGLEPSTPSRWALRSQREAIAVVCRESVRLPENVPWLTLAVIFAAVYVVAMLTTLAPARRAARIFPAEALRYQ
jgi:hypothetical protein